MIPLSVPNLIGNESKYLKNVLSQDGFRPPAPL